MKTLLFSIIIIKLALCIEHNFKGFDDNILFSINWPGPQDILENAIEGDVNKSQNKEILNVQTSHHEKYHCHLPELRKEESKNIAEYDGPSPLHLLKPLFSQKICSYKLESYWNYELCHGRYMRQYHEERDGKQIKLQEYFLGYWTPEKHTKLEAEMKLAQESQISLKTTKVEGKSLPFVEMVMDDGTVCDLSGKPRITRVQYVCFTHGKHEVYSFKETSTCEYEIIILSPLLCEHPQFKPKDEKENVIDCIPIEGAPKKPRSLLKMEVDSLKFHHQTARLMSNDMEVKDVLAVLKVEKIDKDGETHLKLELHPLDDDDLPTTETSTNAITHVPEATENPLAVIMDDSPVRAFLNGENCLNGGTGWWKYEFCYGKHVKQYHVDRTGEKTTLLLGKFDEQAHLDWINENKNKKPKSLDQRMSVSHFYSDGDVCDKTGKPRQTEVKLKCLENSSSSSQVSLYLLEPRTCHYILGVESPLICEILPLADDNGLITSVKLTPKEHPRLTSDDEEIEVKSEEVEKLGND